MISYKAQQTGKPIVGHSGAGRNPSWTMDPGLRRGDEPRSRQLSFVTNRFLLILVEKCHFCQELRKTAGSITFQSGCSANPCPLSSVDSCQQNKRIYSQFIAHLQCCNRYGANLIIISHSCYQEPVFFVVDSGKRHETAIRFFFTSQSHL